MNPSMKTAGNYYLSECVIHKFVLIIMQMKGKLSLTVW